MYSIAFINNEETPGTMRGNMVEDERGRDRKGHLLYGFHLHDIPEKANYRERKKAELPLPGKEHGERGLTFKKHEGHLG